MQWVIFLKKAFLISGVFISGLIGAGFATGSEIFFYFSKFGNKGYMGIALSALLFALLQYEIILQSQRLCAHTIGDYLKKIMPNRLAAVIGIFTYVFMLFILSAMLSGFGELVYLVFGIKKSVGALIMLMITAFILSKGYGFFVKSESVFFVMIVSVMIFVFIYLYAFFNPGIQTFFSHNSWSVSAVSYTGYNMITGAAVLCILSGTAKPKAVFDASCITFIVLTVIMSAAAGIIAMYKNTVAYSSMPLVEICAYCSEPLALIYSFAVFLSMLTTAVSAGYPLCDFVCGSFKTKKCRLIIYAAAYAISGTEFSFIVDKLYRISGFASLIFLFFVVKEKIINN